MNPTEERARRQAELELAMTARRNELLRQSHQAAERHDDAAEAVLMEACFAYLIGRGCTPRSLIHRETS